MCVVSVFQTSLLQWNPPVYGEASSGRGYHNHHLASWVTSFPGSLHVFWRDSFNHFSNWDVQLLYGKKNWFDCIFQVFTLGQSYVLCFMGLFYILVQFCFCFIWNFGYIMKETPKECASLTLNVKMFFCSVIFRKCKQGFHHTNTSRSSLVTVI